MATTASPLPEQQQVQATPADLMLLSAANAVNGTHPAVVAGVASAAQTPGDAAANAQAAAQLSNTQDSVDQLKQQSAKIQQQLWDGFTSQQQNQYRSAGYTPPAPHRSLWGDVTHDVGTAFRDTVGSRGVSDVLNDAMSPLRGVQHGERTLMDMADTAQVAHQDTSGASATQGDSVAKGMAEWGDFFHSLTSVKDWSKAWRETTSGESFIDPSIKQQALDRYGPKTYDLAYALATGQNVQSLLQKVPQAQQQALYQQISSKPVQDAMKLLNAGHASVGRMLVGAGFIARHPEAGNAISGAVDGMMDWFGDPLNVAGAGAGELAHTRYLVSKPEDVQFLFDKHASVRAAMADIAEHVAAKNVDGLLSRYPKLKMAAQQLVAEKADTSEKVLKYFKDTASGMDTISGTPSNVIGEFSPSLPHLTKLGQARLAAKGELMQRIDWAAEKMPNLKTADGDLQTSSSTLDKLAYVPGRMARKALTLIPEKRVLRLTDPDAANVFRDIGLQFLDRDVVNKYLVDFTKDMDVNNRMKVYRSLMLHMGKAAGLDQDPQFWANWTGKFVTQSHLFGVDDDIHLDGAVEHYGFLKRHLAEGVAIPDFREMYLQSRKGIVTKAATNGMNASWIDRFMGLWRPLTLAHLGFATRVGGEEAAAFMLRNGPVAYMRGAAGRTLVKTALREKQKIADATGEDVTQSEAAGIWDRLTAHLPKAAQQRITNMQSLLSEHVVDTVKRSMAKTALGLTDAQYRSAVDAMVKHGVFDQGGPFEKLVTAMHYDTHEAGDLDAQRFVKVKGEAGRYTAAELKGTHEYQEYRPGDQLYMHMFYHQLHQFASDDWGREALRPVGGDLNRGAKYAIRVKRVADKLQADPMWHSESIRSQASRKAGNLSERQRAEDHARVIVKNADRLTSKWVEGSGQTEIIDSSGNPLRVYHGTNKTFETHNKTSEGIYFTSSQKVASYHASKWRGEEPGADRGEPRIQMAYLDMRNPAHLENLSEEAAQDVLANDIPELKSRGHDGVIYKEDEVPAYVVFSPSQVHNTADEIGGAGHYEPIPGLVEHMLEHGRPPSLAVLEETPRAELPSVIGQKYELQRVGVGNVRKATNKLFEKYIGPQINWISRQPMFIHEYSKARLGYAGMARQWRRAGMGDEAVEQLLHDNSMELAFKNTIQYVHNPQLRSEMSAITRNLAPFWFAQEQFYKRWARTMAYSPAAFAKAQLLSHGLRHTGIVHTDPENGQEYFVYPGSSIVQQTLVDVLSKFGVNAEVPVEAGLTGQVSMLNPAIQRIGAPNFGPVVVVPLNELKSVDPHMTQAINGIEGSVAAQSGFIKAVLPSTLTRTLEATFPNAINSAQYASAQMQAIQTLEATGHGIGTPAINQVASKNIANPQAGDYVSDGPQSWVYQPDGKWQLNNAQTLEDFRKRVQNWARIFMVTRLIYGFATPAAPEDQFNPGNMHSELVSLMNEMPVDQAMTIFLAEHPDATAETVFQTQTAGGGFLPATQSAMKFLDDNPTLVKDHPLAAAYLIPAPDTSGKFNLAAYQEQLATGARQRKSPDQFYQEILYQSAAQDYYRVENVKNAMIADHSMPTNQIDNYWTQWQEQFMQANPVFASLQGTGTTGSTLTGTAGGGELGRQQIMDDLGAALADGTAPQNAQTAMLTELYNGWQQWQAQTNTYGNPDQPSVNTGMRIMYDEQFAQALGQFEQQFPGSQALIRRAIAPDLSTAINDLAASGTVVSI